MKDSEAIIFGIFAGLFATLFILSVLAIYYEHKADLRYQDCMYHKAQEICADKQIISFSAWQPHVLCIKKKNESNIYLMNLDYESDPIFFNESDITECWLKSRSVIFMLEHNYTNYCKS